MGPRLPSREHACYRSGREHGTLSCAERSEERLCRGLVLGRTRSCAGETPGGRVSLAPFAGAIPCRMSHLTSECSGRRFAPPLIRHVMPRRRTPLRAVINKLTSGLLLGLLVAPLTAEPQPTVKQARIGYLGVASELSPTSPPGIRSVRRS